MRRRSRMPNSEVNEMSHLFTRFSTRVAEIAGHYIAFTAALGVIIVWALTGPLFGFSDTWQLVINTGTTIVTFLMVFLIQHTQNRDALAMHLKLDEIIRATSAADNEIITAEEETDERMKELKEKYQALHAEHTALQEQLSQYESPVGAVNRSAESRNSNNQ
jgi:low affinity Fe/Cu permease